MNKNDQRGRSVGRMTKRRETMEDGRRYLIYYTFNSQAGKDNSAKGDERSGGKEKNV